MHSLHPGAIYSIFGLDCGHYCNTFTPVGKFKRHMLDTLGSDTWSGVLIVINVETHSIQPIFSKGTYATHWDQTPNSRFCLWIMLQGTNSSWYFENAHAGHPGEALNFCFHSWQFSLMYIATRLMDRTEEELKCDKCDEMFRKKSQIVIHVEVRHVYIHCIYKWQNGGGDIMGDAF